MGATKPASKGKGSKGKSGGSSGKSSKSKSKSKPTGSAPEGISKRKQKSLSLAKPGGAQKTKSIVSKDGKKKKRVYSEKELDIPALNGIVPAGIAKPKGVKKGKKFVDDPVSMMAIMSVVNAEKEGHLESKIAKARQLEEIREAKRKEAEARKEDKEAKFEERKQDLKKNKKRKRHSEPSAKSDEGDKIKEKDRKFKPKKRVSFG
ncbi:60S ribosomal subunit assembly/export protein [Exserohilum turcicum]|uniref:60S ribosomal subunit assembly/export protein LOC1 n=1 Tax=Exserohilum turcicum (strain 28A) TaxID=671987 RepID=R0IU99_EXST2|nr:uncharacterized protein SETTUDRAFT_168314 [Exserohilum turcica Et28A]EOA88385.1 hypothetical protein SETTUDRAFT_168314 [Exserohilum turcica Et28A]